ncbi:hypothetical protein ACNKHU_17835 [Shigella flexneri]
MPDAKKQGRSNKAMTFLVCFLAALAGLLFGLDIGLIAGALPFIADKIAGYFAHARMGRKLHDVRCGSRSVGSGWLSFKLGRKKEPDDRRNFVCCRSLFSAAAPNVEVLILSAFYWGWRWVSPLYRTAVPL